MDIFKACCESPELLDALLLSIQHTIIVTDQDGNVHLANPVVQEVFGYSPDELVGKNLSVVFTSQDVKTLYPNLLFMAKKKEPFEGEVTLIRKDQSSFPAFMTFRPIMDAKHKKSLIVVSVQDIEKLKPPDKGFRDTHYVDLVKVANGIAHELRNPLVAIGGFAKRLHGSCSDMDEGYKEHYNRILDNVKRLEGLADKVDLFARLPKPCLGPESIKALIDEALRPFLKQMEGRRIVLSNNAEEVILFVDKGLVIRAFSILIENALDALSDGGTIQIFSETQDNVCKIHMADTGCGISDDDLPCIFDPFFRTKPDGVGIDLVVLKRIMVGHGGNVEVNSKQGEGTTFSLVFPLERRRPIRVCRLDKK